MLLDPTVIVLGAAAVFVGALLQRVSGMGVGLVVGPALGFLLGPQIGVFATNVVTIGSAAMLTVVRWQAIDWRRVVWILPAAVPGAIAGAWVVGAMSAPWLQVILGTTVLIALALTVLLPELPQADGAPHLVTAGTVGGLLNTTVGIAAPAMVVYSRLAHWGQPAFGATMQPVFMVMGALSVTAKLAMGSVVGAGAMPAWWYLLIALGVAVAGVAAGHVVARKVSATTAGHLAVILAGLGAVGVLVRGAVSLLE